MPKRGVLFFFLCGIALCFGAMTPAAQAQATRTWVADFGNDANTCTRGSPCKTFAGAYNKTAVGGEIDTVDPGPYGSLTITHAITVDAGSALVTSVVAAPGVNAFTVNAGANDRIVLRNIGMNGVNQSGMAATNGIQFNSGASLAVEHCIIEGFSTYGIDFRPPIHAHLTVSDSVLAGNGSFGTAGTGALIASTAAGLGNVNRIGIVSTVVDLGTSGITAGQNTKVELDRVTVGRTGQGGGDYGITATGPGAEVSVDYSTISGNLLGGLHAANNAKMYVANSSITYNGTNGILSDTGGQVLSYGNNRVAGNTGGTTFFGTIPLQ